MDFTPEYKKKIEAEIVEVIISSLEKGVIEEKDLPVISSYVLESIDKVSNQQELLSFLTTLTEKWSIFGSLQKLEVGEVKEQSEQKVVQNVEQLIESGNIEQALAAAKAATSQQQ